MSTQIKKNGNWVTVAGGTRMWVGTKAALQAALDAGELVDGTAVMVTDDYEETPETGIATLATNWAGNIRYAKAGHVVQVSVRNLQYTPGGTPATDTVIATGLPKPVIANPTEIFIAGNNGDIGGNYVGILDNGSLVVKNFNNTTIISHFDSFTYITSE